MTNTQKPDYPSAKSGKGFNPIIIIGVLFFIFGFVTWLNGTLIPFLKTACELNNFQAYLVTFAFYISYFVMSIPSSQLLKKIGFRKGIAWGLFVMAFGSILFIPAAYARSYVTFLVGLFIQGSGLALLQTASNPYVTLLGPEESAAKRMSIMGICNKVAGVISPMVLGAIVLKGMDEVKANLASATGLDKTQLLDAMAQRVVLPYIVIAIVLFVLSILISFIHLPEVEAEEESEAEVENQKSVFQFPHLVLGLIALFGYVGVEVLAGDTIIQYGVSQGISMDSARVFTSYTLASMVIGYLLSITLIPKFISQEKALLVAAILGVVLSLGVINLDGMASIYCLALLGLANAVMWPAIFPLSILGLGRFTKIGSALLIMMIAGGAVIPLLYGKLTDVMQNSQQPYWMMVPIYLYIGYFALHGHRVGRKKDVNA